MSFQLLQNSGETIQLRIEKDEGDQKNQLTTGKLLGEAIDENEDEFSEDEPKYSKSDSLRRNRASPSKR